ncbi:treslin isoform X1 [Alosa sapidissima]|uniref:treslin isoform X1 n=1 Tax=Alosa sapidissima TaxID=34773 RepID=UPI001C09E1B6|nr:treslin isoform X1 [Alosa sapidissima]
MASHNVVFVIDVDQQTEFTIDSSSVIPHPLKQWILRILLCFGNKYGIEKVRWGYKFFYSRVPRSTNLIARGSDLKEITEKSFDDFESEFSSKFDGKAATLPRAHQKLRTTPAAAVQNATKEALLDFQWDRPDITSPTKLILRPKRASHFGRATASPDDELSNQGNNVLFVLTRCPHSQADMEDFVFPRGNNSSGLKDMSDHILPKGLQDILLQRRVVLHWIDTTAYCQAVHCEDNLGSDIISDALRQMGGSVVPMDTLHSACYPNRQEGPPQGCPPAGEGRAVFPLDSSISYIFSSQKLHSLSFPLVGGVLRWGQDENARTGSVSLKPMSSRQSLLSAPVVITLRALLHNWDSHIVEQVVTESWMLQATDDQPDFSHLMKEILSQGIHMVADVSCGGLTHSAVLSPLSTHTAILSVLRPPMVLGSEYVTPDLRVTPDLASTVCDEELADLPDVVSSVLSVVYDLMKDEDRCDEKVNGQIPDWANQELRHRSSSVSTGLVEYWFPESDESGVSANLMESMRLLHAAPDEAELEEGEELSGPQQELFSGLSELYQSSTSEGHLKGKKRGAQRTPVRQKMKTMSRSLQMLNFARLNVKAQKSCSDPEPLGGGKGLEKTGKRQSGDQAKASSGAMHFKSEAELLSQLKSRYHKAVEERHCPLSSVVQSLLGMVKTFLKSTNSSEEQTSTLIEKSLLKSSQSVRQLYGNDSDTEGKVRECQLQAALRVELCQQMSSNPENSDRLEEMVEEVTDMLRIISLTRDPVYLAKFMQDELLPLYLTAIPRILADVYNSLGTQLPEVLVAVLPSDFFSDESVQKDSVSPAPSSVSAMQNSASGERLDELRNRSARKKRSGMLTRHRSLTEASQTLRQIEMPRKSTRVVKETKPKPKLSISVEKTNLEQPPPKKQEVQEVTKVRRNLFNQETFSPTKKSKMPRSHSVSAVEGLRKRKRSQLTENSDHHSLLTKKVTETPLHKQVSNRLLQRQMTGRRSGESDVSIVEESPVKPPADVRRSPRIKSLTRRHSSVFYSNSQPRSRNLDRVLSSSQLCSSEGRIGSISVGAVKSPVRLLFGAAKSPERPATSSESTGVRSSRRFLIGSTESDVFESPNKTPRKSPYKTPTKSPHKLPASVMGSGTPRKSPYKTPTKSPHKLPPSVMGSGTPRTLRSSTMALGSVGSRRLGTQGANRRTMRGSPCRSPAQREPLLQTPKKSPLKGILRTPVKKDSPLKGLVRTPGKGILRTPVKKDSPLKGLVRTPGKGILKTPVKTLLDCISPGGAQMFQSPSIRTPKKSVTWSPSPRKLQAEAVQSPFKVPESPCYPTRISPRLLTPVKFCSPSKSVRHGSNVFKTPEKSPQRINQTSPVIPLQNSPRRALRNLRTPVKDVQAVEELTTSGVQNSAKSPSTPKTPTLISGPTHCMLTRSSRTPLKDSPHQSPNHTLATPDKTNVTSDKSDTILQRTPENISCNSDNVTQGRQYNLRRSPHERLPLQNNEGSPKTLKKGLKSRYDPGQSAERGVQDGSSSDSQHLDSSQFSAVTTEDESMDIAEASIVKTQLTGGLKMNISFSRKSSKSSDVFEFAGSQKTESGATTPSQKYGFRQTPDRRQREAAARLGYSTSPPKFSTPRASKAQQKTANTSNTLTYQVELEMQTSGLPKLRFKRTDSFGGGDAFGDGMAKVASPNVRFSKTTRVESPLTHCGKHRDPSCRSPSLCPRGTPAKGTPGKASIQTYICQSYTPTHTPGGTPSPTPAAEPIPWTPSPQSRGRCTPDSLNSWPRKKRVGVVSNKDQGIWGQPLLEEMEELEDPDLDGVFRLQEVEECKDLGFTSRLRKTSVEPSPAKGLANVPLDQAEDMDWTEALVPQFDAKDALRCDDIPWLSGKDSISAVVTPPSSKVKKTVSASGILALTQSPLLFKGKTSSTAKRTAEMEDESRKNVLFEVDQSPLNQPRRRRTYSRKRLLD